MADDTWIVTCYYNPCRYQTKKYNFDVFAERLRSTRANLLVVEMALEDREFELSGEFERVGVRGNGVMWQKERMLNVAVSRLPPSCTKVAWLDCDLLFEDDGWLQKTSDALEQFAVVQPFETCVRLPRGHLEFRGEGQEGHPVTESFAAAFVRDPRLAHEAKFQVHGHTGFAWAARREVLDRCGLFDACLTGSGDHLMAHVFAGALNSPCIPAMIGSGNEYADYFARWGVDVDRIVRGNLGHVPGRVLHLWHGTVADRRYAARNQEFQTFDFDPERHIRIAESGLWDWAEAPDELRAWANELFASRREDGDRVQSEQES